MRTRLKCALVILLLALARLVSAQDIGSKAGVGYSGFSGASEFAWTRNALSASAFAVVRVNDAIDLQPELWLRGQAGHSVVASSELSYGATYIALPVLGRYALAKTRFALPYVIAGPLLTYRTRCSLVFRAGAFASNLGCGNSSRLSLGVDGGAGVELGTKATRVVAEARVAGNVSTTAIGGGATRARGHSWSLVVGFLRPFRMSERASAAKDSTAQ